MDFKWLWLSLACILKLHGAQIHCWEIFLQTEGLHSHKGSFHDMLGIHKLPGLIPSISDKGWEKNHAWNGGELLPTTTDTAEQQRPMVWLRIRQLLTFTFMLLMPRDISLQILVTECYASWIQVWSSKAVLTSLCLVLQTMVAYTLVPQHTGEFCGCRNPWIIKLVGLGIFNPPELAGAELWSSLEGVLRAV